MKEMKKKGLLEIIKGWIFESEEPSKEEIIINKGPERITPQPTDEMVEPEAVEPQKPEVSIKLPEQEVLIKQPKPIPPAAPAYKEKVYKVAGISHYMDGIMELAEENDDYNLKKKELIEYEMTDQRIWKYEFSPYETELVPEPDNPEDPKAIKVIVNGTHIGYIKAGSCAHLLKVIREERIIEIDCDIYGGPYKYISENWDDEKDDFVYDLERETVPYGAKLTVKEK